MKLYILMDCENTKKSKAALVKQVPLLPKQTIKLTKLTKLTKQTNKH